MERLLSSGAGEVGNVDGKPAGSSIGKVGRRYVPLAVVMAVQVALLVVAPSKPATRPAGTVADSSPSQDAVPRDASAAPDASALVAGGDVGPVSTIAAGIGRPGVAGRSPGASTNAPGATSGATSAAGDVAHCVAGRQFDPAIDFYAPPCQPRFTGSNSGATAQGVTSDEILLIDYYIEPGPGPSTFLEAQQMGASLEEQRQFNQAAAKFINEHFELYGREVRIEMWPSPCPVQPPEESCFRADAAQVVADKKPFAVVNSSVAAMSFFYDELSQRQTVNVGGWQLRDEFSAARRPFHWDPNISGTRMARIFAEFYCGQMHGRPVQYAGTPRRPDSSFNGRPRVLGVVALNDAENIAIVNDVLPPELAKCGAKVAHTYFVEPNIQRGKEQNRAAVAKMRETPEATVVLCICGPALALLHEQMQEDDYYPEHLLPGNSMTDIDSVAQFFTGALGCPTGVNCQAENMFGLAQLGPQEPRFQGVGTRVWRAAGNRGNPPYERVDLDWTYWSMLASLMQAAGPGLTPAALERAAVTLPGLGGGITGYPRRQFDGTSHSWIRDMRAVYWSTTKRSQYNGAAGTWAQLGDSRFEAGTVPTGALVLPPKPR